MWQYVLKTEHKLGMEIYKATLYRSGQPQWSSSFMSKEIAYTQLLQQYYTRKGA